VDSRAVANKTYLFVYSDKSKGKEKGRRACHSVSFSISLMDTDKGRGRSEKEQRGASTQSTRVITLCFAVEERREELGKKGCKEEI